MNRLKRFIIPTLCATVLSGAVHAEERTLRVYNWFDYITPKALEDFKAQNTQTKLVYDIFDTNEALEAKLLTGNSGYDVVVPSNVFLAKQIEAGVFQPVDRSKLPNWNHLDPKLMNLDPNSKKPADYDKAEALLMKIRPYVTYFHSSKYMADIANGDICVAVGYSGSFSQAANRAKEAKNGVIVDMRLPKEGAPIWFDMLAIPKGAKNPEDAYTFINYLLQPQVIAPVSDFVGYPNPNKDATELVDPAIRNNPNLYPTETAMSTLYTLQPLPRDAERARTRAWTKIKSGT
jgi:spermidine/putrescine-binding protein